ncbi:MAG: hypothetical protein CMJ48_13800 [Planctomycetaceae bacterium]|nr:hypothetical protein [Planctomycetaceae bacterium]
MSEQSTCPECGAEIPLERAGAPCPACLLRIGLETWTHRNHAAPSDGGEHPDFEAPQPAELSRTFPQLEVLRLIGKGGMGAVYHARQKSLDRDVALKIINPEIVGEAGFEERFIREARALARLNHPNVVTVYDFGQTEGVFYFVMEFVDGVTLRETLEGGPLQPREALKVVPHLCDALQYAHDEGVVHRDIKPENILVDRRGRVKIADFGLAKLLDDSAAPSTLTGTHEVMGTLRYMAPEQMEGTHAVDHRADIYSLGVVFYELLTGETPMGRFAPPSKKVHIDVRLDDVVLRTLEREPNRRYQQASQLKTDIQTIEHAPAAPATGTPATPSDEENPLDVLKIPATGLLVAGIIDCVGLLIALVVVASQNVSSGEALLIVGLQLAGPFVVAGAWAMLYGGSGRVAFIGVCAALIPNMSGFFFGIAFAVVALVHLTKPEVRRAFRERSKSVDFGERQFLLASAAIAIVGSLGIGTACILAGDLTWRLVLRANWGITYSANSHFRAIAGVADPTGQFAMLGAILVLGLATLGLAMRMQKRDRFDFAILGATGALVLSILLTILVHLAFQLALPLCLVALVLLCQQRVIAQFDDRRDATRHDDRDVGTEGIAAQFLRARTGLRVTSAINMTIWSVWLGGALLAYVNTSEGTQDNLESLLAVGLGVLGGIIGLRILLGTSSLGTGNNPARDKRTCFLAMLFPISPAAFLAVPSALIAIAALNRTANSPGFTFEESAFARKRPTHRGPVYWFALLASILIGVILFGVLLFAVMLIVPYLAKQERQQRIHLPVDRPAAAGNSVDGMDDSDESSMVGGMDMLERDVDSSSEDAPDAGVSSGFSDDESNDDPSPNSTTPPAKKSEPTKPVPDAHESPASQPPKTSEKDAATDETRS